MEIEILNTHKNDFSPVIGERTMELLSRFGQKLDEDGIVLKQLKSYRIVQTPTKMKCSL